MWGAALRQIEAAFDARLSGAIDQVATLRGVTLVNTFERFRWRVPELNVRFGQQAAVVIRPAGLATSNERIDLIRDGFMPVDIAYGFQHQDHEIVADQLEFVPEAMVMIAEVMDELATDVLDVADPIETEWFPSIFRELNHPFQGWVRLRCRFEVYTQGIALA